MKINYNVTGAERKSLVGAISKELNAPTKYLGMPTAAYEVGEYTIDKTGTVTGPDNPYLIEHISGSYSLTPENVEYDAPPTETTENPEAPAFEDLQLTEREELGLGRERRDYPGEDGMQASDVPDDDEECPDVDRQQPDHCADPDAPVTEETENQAEESPPPETHGSENDSLIIEMPLTGFTPEKLDNLTKLVGAKAPLLKVALGVDDLPIQQTEETLRFPWFWPESILTGEEVTAYSTLISLLCKTAKEKKRVTAKEKEVKNPKFAMRCFLLSLGFIGDEYKVSRKILLSKLEGNSSWKNGKKADAPTEMENFNTEGIEAAFSEAHTPPENVGALTYPEDGGSFENEVTDGE